ncbi:MAG: MerR family transcriptional regulator [Gammaproteobacteria bacterium]|nr:MerR family transcriptional regulator [Gammaproteobacteria bacterium]
MFTIGEFARLGAVSVRRLRHWDAIGLLVPAEVDRFTGYRYYNASQLARLNRIVVLRELGFSLQEIGEIADAVTLEALTGLLDKRYSELEAELDERQRRLAAVSARLHALKRYGTLPDYEIALRSLPAIRFAAIKAQVPGFGVANCAPVLRPLYKSLRQSFAAAGLTSAGFYFVLFDEGDPDAGNLHAYSCLGVSGAVDNVPPPAKLYRLPAVASAMTVLRHLDDPPSYNHIYAELSEWADDNGWTPVGAGRDIVIELSADGAVVMETQWPVRRKDGSGPTPVVLPIPCD